MADEKLAFAQARWEHLNSSENLLTASQAMMIDAHFVIEQRMRSNTKLLLPFNGTCGVWRRAAIDDAGGWSADTLCEGPRSVDPRPPEGMEWGVPARPGGAG